MLTKEQVPVALLLAYAIHLAAENFLIQRKLSEVSPLVTQPVYALCYLLICALAYPFRESLQMGIKEFPAEKIPWILLSATIFASGALIFFQAYAKGATPFMVMTVLTILPVFVGIITCIVERKWPTMNMLGACAMVMGAVWLICRDLPKADATPG